MQSPKQSSSNNLLVKAASDCRSLYERCLTRQQELDSQDQRIQKEAWIAMLTFGPLLQRNPELESSPSPLDPAELKTSKDQWMAEKFRQLLNHTKTASQQNLVQLYRILAMWLQDEGIVSAQEFLPHNVFSQLTETTSEVFGRYRPAMKYNADLVEAWLPYFEHLMRAYRLLNQTKEKQVEKKLKEVGYEADAVRIVVDQQHRTRTARSAAIQFVASRKALDEYTIRTAHSRIYGARRSVSVDPL
jgi:hypothetical protein